MGSDLRPLFSRLFYTFSLINNVLWTIVIYLYNVPGIGKLKPLADKSEARREEGPSNKADQNLYVRTVFSEENFMQNTGSNRSQEICDRNFHWRERKINK